MMEILVFAALAIIVIMAEYYSGKQRAETDNKIDEMHKWLRRNHPYKFNGFEDNEHQKQNTNNNQQTTNQNETN